MMYPAECLRGILTFGISKAIKMTHFTVISAYPGAKKMIIIKDIYMLTDGRDDMAYYFMIDTYISDNGNREEYDDYIEKVKPIVEKHGGEYLARTENIQYLSDNRKPQRIILIRFGSKEALDACFSSEEYRAIM